MSDFHTRVWYLAREYETAHSSEIVQALRCTPSQIWAVGHMEMFRKRDAEQLKLRNVPDPKFVRIMHKRLLEARLAAGEAA